MRIELPLAGKLAADLLAITAAVAALVHFFAAERARDLLGFGSNTKILAAVLAACLAVQVGRAAAEGQATRLAYRSLACVCDGTLLLACSIQVVVIGAAYGAYGLRTVEATVAHGPFELAAFSLGLALYIDGRCAPLRWTRFANCAAAAITLLAIGAALEAYI